jgi:uncharacterized membrane protein YadS
MASDWSLCGPPSPRCLLAIGTAVCGCTAVVAVSPVIRSRGAETAFAVTCVVLFGCLGMLFYSWLAGALFAASPVHAGVYSTLWQALVNTGESASDVLLVCGMTALGLSVSFGEMWRIGWRPLAAGWLVAFLVGICSLGLNLMEHRLGW